MSLEKWEKHVLRSTKEFLCSKVAYESKYKRIQYRSTTLSSQLETLLHYLQASILNWIKLVKTGIAGLNLCFGFIRV